MRITRRRMMAAGGAAVTSVLAARPGSATAAGAPAPAEPLEILDTHIHVWDPADRRLNPPWLAGAAAVLRRKFMLDEYAAATRGTGIARAVYVEIAMAEADRPAEAAAVLEIVRQTKGPIAGVVIGADPAGEGFARFVRGFKDTASVRGVRSYFRKGAEADAKFVAGMRLLGELGLVFDLQGSLETLAGAAKVARACPGTRFVLDHCGVGRVNWYVAGARLDEQQTAQRDGWERMIGELAELPNVACKISGVAESGAPVLEPTADVLRPVVDRCIDRFGPERVMFGSDWPVCLKAITIAKWVEALKAITAGRGEAFARALFRTNGERWYFQRG